MIFADSLPGFKTLLCPLALPVHALCHVTAFVAAFALVSAMGVLSPNGTWNERSRSR